MAIDDGSLSHLVVSQRDPARNASVVEVKPAIPQHHLTSHRKQKLLHSMAERIEPIPVPGAGIDESGTSLAGNASDGGEVPTSRRSDGRAEARAMNISERQIPNLVVIC